MSTTTAKQTPELHEERWCYIGQRRGAKYPLVDGWRAFAADGSSLGEDEKFYKAGRSRYVVGGIYVIQCDAAGHRYGEPAYSGATYGKDDVVLQWRVAHDAARLITQLDREERGAKEEELAALKPLQMRYLSASSLERAVIEVQVLQYLRMARARP